MTARRISGPEVVSRLEGVRSRILIAMAAEQVGLARRCLEMAVEYAGTRQQFGRTIGSFQGIKHKLVDLLVVIELAEATGWTPRVAPSAVRRRWQTSPRRPGCWPRGRR